MTTIYEKIKADLVRFRKEGNHFPKGELILLVSNIDALAKEAKLDVPTDEIVFQAVQKAIKVLQEQIQIARTDGLKDILEQSRLLLEGYLPQRITGGELLEKVKDTIENNPDIKMGQVIGTIKKELGFKVDGKELSQLVKGLF